eukprot:TRINITY_DN10029_c0_g1_i2.p1 TRINITY_DN10029_c0_g1~~TRINITY_DN10029_c0_g1_i2.p1  ORF type:complete len:218 (-),score=58.80 TRINITY_DN10029_c0_g1_i2:103-756(-)
MPIVYSLVARGNTAICHFASSSGNFAYLASYLLGQIPGLDAPGAKLQASRAYEGYVFHVLADSGLTVVCTTDDQFDRRVAFAFLFDTLGRFASYVGASSGPLDQEALSRELANQMDYFSHNPAADKVNKVRAQLDATKQVLNDNVEKLMHRAEALETLSAKTQHVTDKAQAFSRQARRLESQLWTKNVKTTAALVCLALVILWLFLSLFCGLSLRHC